MPRLLLSLLAILLLCLTPPTWAAVTGWSSANYLDRAAAVWPGQLPFLMSAWVYTPLTASTRNIMALGITDVTHLRRLFLGSTHTLTAQSRTTSSFASATTNTITANTWSHTAGAFMTTSTRQPYLNNDATTVPGGGFSGTINTPTYTVIGKYPGAATDLWPNTGALAEISIWDVAGFSQANQNALVSELATLQGGTSARNPLAINAQAQPWAGKLVAYWRLTSQTDLTDLTLHGHNLTMQGTLTTFGSHAPVDAVPTAGPASRVIIID